MTFKKCCPNLAVVGWFVLRCLGRFNSISSILRLGSRKNRISEIEVARPVSNPAHKSAVIARICLRTATMRLTCICALLTFILWDIHLSRTICPEASIGGKFDSSVTLGTYMYCYILFRDQSCDPHNKAVIYQSRVWFNWKGRTGGICGSHCQSNRSDCVVFHAYIIWIKIKSKLTVSNYQSISFFSLLSWLLVIKKKSSQVKAY